MSLERMWIAQATNPPLVQDADIRRVGFEQSRPQRRKKRKKGGRTAADFWSYLVTFMIGVFGFSCAEGGRRKQSGTESSGCSAKGGKATCGPRRGEQPAASIRHHPERFPGSSTRGPESFRIVRSKLCLHPLGASHSGGADAGLSCAIATAAANATAYKFCERPGPHFRVFSPIFPIFVAEKRCFG